MCRFSVPPPSVFISSFCRPPCSPGLSAVVGFWSLPLWFFIDLHFAFAALCLSFFFYFFILLLSILSFVTRFMFFPWSKLCLIKLAFCSLVQPPTSIADSLIAAHLLVFTGGKRFALH